MKAVRIPRVEAEKVRRLAEKTGAKDKNRLIVTRGEFVEIPIYDGYEELFSQYEIIQQENPVFKKKADLLHVLKPLIPENLHHLIPRSYKIVGDIALVKIPHELESFAELIAEKIMEIHPRLKAVWRDFGKEGMLRRPHLQLLSGEGSETLHREFGCVYRLDVTKVMFSPGNLGEKMRLVRLVRNGETIVDMFAGIGYFTIPLAVHTKARRIYSIEINPDSYHYLLENIRLNRAENVITILGDSMKVTPEGVADRVVMGHIFCHEFLQVAICALKPEGGVIHYHESVPEAVIQRPVERVKNAAEKAGRKVEIAGFRKVKNYSPGVVHVVVDAKIV